MPISTDIDEAYEQATQYMTNINLSPEELIKNLNQQKTALEGERLIVSKEAKGWGFRYFEPKMNTIMILILFTTKLPPQQVAKQ